MALNIQWRFQEPIDFSNALNKSLENKQRTYSEIAKNLGEGIRNTHDYLLDRDLANLIENQMKQKQFDSSNKEQLDKETTLVKQEIERLKTERAKLQNELNEIETMANEAPEKSSADYNELFDTGRLNNELPRLGNTGGRQYGF